MSKFEKLLLRLKGRPREVFFVKVTGIRDVVTFEGDSVAVTSG